MRAGPEQGTRAATGAGGRFFARAVLSATLACGVCHGGQADQAAHAPASNLARGKPVRVDSVYNSDYPPAHAVDGDWVGVASRWLSARTNNLDWSKNPHWIEIDLLGEFLITEMRFWSGAQNEYKWPPADFTFQRWHDGAWIEIFAETGNDRPVYARRFPPVPAGKVRLIATRGTDPGALRLYEIEVYGR
jgi:hypothetical protein